MRDIPYNNRTDLQKIQSQWNKIAGLLSRGRDWSAVIVRAATACEIAANFVIRKKFSEKSTFAPAYVDSNLIWANGIKGKFQNLIVPMFNAEDKKVGAAMKKLGERALKINEDRNAIVHSGAFSDEKEARAIVESARTLIEELVGTYEAGFKLVDGKPSKAPPTAKADGTPK